MEDVSMSDVYIVGLKRTPIGKYGKALRSFSAIDLGAFAIKGAIEDAGIQKEKVEEVVMGNVISAGLGQDPGRQAAIMAGIPVESSGSTVNMVCASGMLSIANAFRSIKLGERDIMVAGGMESMSNSPFILDSSFRWGDKRLNPSRPVMDAMINDGLWDFKYHRHMGAIADEWARKHGITRDMADNFSYESYRRAMDSTKKGLFKKEIIPIDGLDFDEGIRETSKEQLSKLEPAFAKDGILTAGNSSQLSDGGAAVVLASEDAVKKYNLKKRARILGVDTTSMDPFDFPYSPVPSSKRLMEKLGLGIKQFDLVEHNEAFSIASLAVMQGLGAEWDTFNVRGGAVAMGHPLGASGARITITLLRALEDMSLHRGLATICHGGGGAYSIAIEVM